MTLSKGAAAAKRKRSVSPPRGRPIRIRKPTEKAAAAAAPAIQASQSRKATVRTEEEEDALHNGMEVIEIPSDDSSEAEGPIATADDSEVEVEVVEEDAEAEMSKYLVN